VNSNDPRCVNATDWRIVRTGDLRSADGLYGGYVHLHYSPSTRCVYGSIEVSRGHRYAQATLVRHDSVHNDDDYASCDVLEGEGGTCATEKLYDGDIPGGGGADYTSHTRGIAYLTSNDIEFRGKTAPPY
jgi:hypothetical protein